MFSIVNGEYQEHDYGSWTSATIVCNCREFLWLLIDQMKHFLWLNDHEREHFSIFWIREPIILSLILLTVHLLQWIQYSMWLTKRIVPFCTIHLLLDISTVGLFFQTKVTAFWFGSFSFFCHLLVCPFDLSSATRLCPGLLLQFSSWVLFNFVLSFNVSLVNALGIMIKTL